MQLALCLSIPFCSVTAFLWLLDLTATLQHSMRAVAGSSSGCAFLQCAGCHKTFKRVANCFLQSPIFKQLYIARQDLIPGRVSNNLATLFSTLWRSMFSFSNDTPSVTCPLVLRNLIFNKKDYKLSVDWQDEWFAVVWREEECILEDDCEDGFPLLDDALFWNREGEGHHVDEERAPNRCVLKFYEELLDILSNPLGLDQFSCEEEVHFELLLVFKVVRPRH